MIIPNNIEHDIDQKIRLAAKHVVDVFTRNNHILALAESCTGGMVSSAITNVAGCSKMFSGGVLAYSNAFKQNLLSINVDDAKRYGSVSEQIATQMANGALKADETANIALAITGIAGPSGGSDEKPVGSLHISIVQKTGEQSNHSFLFNGDRQFIRQKATLCSLNLLIKIN